MKVKLKKDVKGVPSHSSCCGFDPDIRTKLNQGKTVEVDSVTELGKKYVEIVNNTKGGK